LPRENFFKQIEARIAPRLKVKQEEDGCTEIAYDFADNVIGLVLVASQIGTADLDFYNGLVNQLANAASTRQKVSERTLNFMLAVIKDIKPRDQVETMLAAQMAAVHLAIMTFARRLANVDNIPQQDSAELAFNKLLRTFTTQMEALKRYRTSGEQKVTVQHVSVREGGQAIVGNVNQAPREGAPSKATAPPALTDSSSTAMPIVEQTKQTTAARKRRGK